MKRLLTVIAFCATAFATAGTLTAPAAADSGRHGSGLYTQGSGGNFVFRFHSGDRRHGVQRAERRDHKMRRHHKFKRHHARRHNARRHHAHQGHVTRHHQRLGHGQRRGHGQRQGYGQRLGHAGRIAAASCDRVRRHGVDRCGYRVLFGGVMCDDAHGTSNVVDGSRTVVRRY